MCSSRLTFSAYSASARARCKRRHSDGCAPHSSSLNGVGEADTRASPTLSTGLSPVRLVPLSRLAIAPETTRGEERRQMEIAAKRANKK